MSQKNGTASRQIKATVKVASTKPKDCPSPLPTVQNGSPEKNVNGEQEAEEEKSKDETEEVDVGCESPVSKDNHNVTKTDLVVDSEYREGTDDKSLPRQSAFSPVAPTRDGADQPSVVQSVDPKTSTLHQPSFPWGPISPSLPLKPYPAPMVPEYPPYILPDRVLYQQYYLAANQHRSDPSSPFRPDFLDPQRPVVPQPVAPGYPSLFPPYPYRYCHSLHPAPPLQYTLYRPHDMPMPITGPRYLPLDLYGPNHGPKDYNFYMQARSSHNAGRGEGSNQGQSSDKATRLSPTEGCSASGSPDRPCNAQNIQMDTEGPHYTTLGGHTPKPLQVNRPDSRQENSAQILLQLRGQHLDAGSAEKRQYASTSGSEALSEYETDNKEDMAPLNLSTKTQDRENESQSPHRPGDETANLSRDEVPLNLSLRASHVSPSTWGTSENSQQRPDVEMEEEEVCDQRQTAALALCQLATASSAASLCDISMADKALVELSETNPEFSEKAKRTTKTKPKTVKRKNKGKSENNCNKPNKKTKTTGRALRRRPRCC